MLLKDSGDAHRKDLFFFPSCLWSSVGDSLAKENLFYSLMRAIMDYINEIGKHD